MIRGRDTALPIIMNVERAVNNGGGTFTIQRSLRGVVEYRATYWVSEQIQPDDVHNVALAIFMDFEFGFESWQGGVLFGAVSFSSFAMEDFPSDYIGFFDAISHEHDYLDAISLLGPVSVASDPPKNSCVGPACDRFDVKNWDYNNFTRMKEIDGRWENTPWPPELQMTPINNPHLWQLQEEQSCLLSITILCVGY